MWYKSVNAGTEEGLTMLKNDKNAMDIARIGVKDDTVELYVVHKTGDEAGPGPIVVYKGHGVGLGTKHTTVGPTEVEEVGSMSEGSCEEVKGLMLLKKKMRGTIVLKVLTLVVVMMTERGGGEGLINVNIIGEGEKKSVLSQTQTQSLQPAAPTRGKEKIVGEFGDEDEGYNSENFLDIQLSDDEDGMLGKRPIGCFLKTPYGGWLLTTMGWDSNDQILLIIYAVVEAKTKDS
ncbi:hypothetical protein Ahy_B03g061903 [Arachis hypogaea]|uniref:Uncharacterized protein n=1 Tax=Arachis hypogaea TaxID=3818 RepID=A0A444ZSE1_ARAHY|nr:hypothetical protein Ahy_B03g061903 [Arachis hypogaea]